MLLISVAIAGLRLAWIKDPAFQAAAHLWVGFLIWGWLIDRNQQARALVLILSVVEVAAFILIR
jgi:diacylglycerol kinase